MTMPNQDPSSAVVDAFLEYEDRVVAGHDVSGTELEQYEQRLGDEYPTFLDLIDARSALVDLIEPPPVDELPQTFGSFTLMHVLGSGGAGVVYKAYNRDVRRYEAVKLLRGGFERDGHTVARFRREAAAAASVVNPSIVKIHTTGEHDRKPYIAMELIDGPTLKAWSKDGVPVSMEELCARLADIADGLASLHEIGNVHRDVKPSNVMVRPDGTFVLMDFGLAHGQLGTTITVAGEMLGTPYYMCPEQMQGQPVAPPCDIYSLGATLFHVLTGRPPFDASNVMELAKKASIDRPVAPSSLNPAVPPALDRIVLKCLEKSPDDRYPDAASLRDDLLALARGGDVDGHPVSSTRLAVRKLRRLAPIGIVVGVVVGLLLFGWMTRPSLLQIELGDDLVGEVYLDQDLRGSTPIETELEPNRRYWMELRVPGYLPKGQRIGTDGSSQLFYDESDLTPVPVLATHRGGASGSGVVIGPQGKVRVSDAKRLLLSTNEDVIDGEVVFRRGDSELGRVPFEGEPTVDLAVPASITSRLRPGDKVVVRVSGGDESFEAAFEVVEDVADLDMALADVDAALSVGPQRRYARSRALAAAGLDYASLRALLPGLLEPATVSVDDLPVLAGAYAALEQLEAVDSALATELELRIRGLPEAARAPWVRED